MDPSNVPESLSQIAANINHYHLFNPQVTFQIDQPKSIFQRTIFEKEIIVYKKRVRQGVSYR